SKLSRKIPGLSPRGFDGEYKQIAELLARRSYIDALVGLGESKALVRQVREYASEQLKAVRQRLEASESAFRDELARLKENRGVASGAMGILGALCGVLLGGRGCFAVMHATDRLKERPHLPWWPRGSGGVDPDVWGLPLGLAVFLGTIVVTGGGLAAVGWVLGRQRSSTSSEALQEAQKAGEVLPGVVRGLEALHLSGTECGTADLPIPEVDPKSTTNGLGS
ncbi:MAG: hypothetical protein HN341_19665, partial [Verrucomicrobia bacterium]|nr:hypothetical protein [Verrucomicrobiota bacterium]